MGYRTKESYLAKSDEAKERQLQDLKMGRRKHNKIPMETLAQWHGIFSALRYGIMA